MESLLEDMNGNFRCLLCTKILPPEDDDKIFVFGIPHSEQLPQKIFAHNNKGLLLLSSLYNCLTDPDEKSYSIKQVSYHDDSNYDPENCVHFCPNCENYLVEFETLTQTIAIAQRRLSAVKCTVIAKFLSASEIQRDDLNNGPTDSGILFNYPKFRAMREKLKNDFVPTVVLEKASSAQATVPPAAFETQCFNDDDYVNYDDGNATPSALETEHCSDNDYDDGSTIPPMCKTQCLNDTDDDDGNTGYETDEDYCDCPSEISLDPDEPFIRCQNDNPNSLHSGSDPEAEQKPKVHRRTVYKCVRLGAGEYLYGNKYKFCVKDHRFQCCECSLRLVGRKQMINHIRKVHMSLPDGKKKGRGKSKMADKCKKIGPNEFIYAENYKISFYGQRYYCQECFSHYSKMEGVFKHIRDYHINNTVESKTVRKTRNNRLIPVQNNPNLFRYRFKYEVSFIPDTGTYKCQSCSLERGSPAEMMNHIENIHFKPERSITSQSGLTATIAPNEFLYIEKYPFRFVPTEQIYVCGLCGYQNDSIRCMYPHIRAKHYTDEDKQQFGAVQVSENEYLYGGKYQIFFQGGKYTCALCNLQRFDLPDLYGHIRSRHFNDEPAEQLLPHENASSEDVLGTGAIVKTDFKHHGIPYSYEECSRKYICSVCSVSVGLRSSMMAHIKNLHTGQPGQFVCEICGESFQAKRYLNKHRSNHGGQKFSCPHCSKQYRDEKNFKAHVAIHELGDEAKRYQCEYCGKKFRKKTFLDVHVRIHTGEKPVKCDLCPEMFANTAKRYYHRKTVHGIVPQKVYLD